MIFDFALFAVMFGGAILLLIALASRANGRMKRRPPAAEGVNRAERRGETVETRHKRR